MWKLPKGSMNISLKTLEIYIYVFQLRIYTVRIMHRLQTRFNFRAISLMELDNICINMKKRKTKESSNRHFIRLLEHRW